MSRANSSPRREAASPPHQDVLPSKKANTLCTLQFNAVSRRDVSVLQSTDSAFAVLGAFQARGSVRMSLRLHFNIAVTRKIRWSIHILE
jgi:hypothetical protein